MVADNVNLTDDSAADLNLASSFSMSNSDVGSQPTSTPTNRTTISNSGSAGGSNRAAPLKFCRDRNLRTAASSICDYQSFGHSIGVVQEQIRNQLPLSELCQFQGNRSHEELWDAIDESQLML